MNSYSLYLLSNMTITDIKKRFQGSILGIFWAVIAPLIMLVIYTVIFSEVFSIKWNSDTSNKFEFAMMLFCGLCMYNMFSTVLGRSVGLIEQNKNFVKKVVFPIEILPVTITLSALFDCVISIIVLIAATFILTSNITITILQVPVILLPHIVFCLGIAYFFSALSVYVKDMANFISILITVCMYASPVFFPLSALPEKFRFFIMLNPMTYGMENMRLAVIHGEVLNFEYYLISVVSAVTFHLAGKWVFNKAKRGFADLL